MEKNVKTPRKCKNSADYFCDTCGLHYLFKEKNMVLEKKAIDVNFKCKVGD